MKIEQTEMQFNPIRIILETRREANAFITMIDNIEYVNNDQKDLCNKIADAFSNMEVQY